eukprot:2845356-Rhodomonas_salina.1
MHSNDGRGCHVQDGSGMIDYEEYSDAVLSWPALVQPQIVPRQDLLRRGFKLSGTAQLLARSGYLVRDRYGAAWVSRKSVVGQKRARHALCEAASSADASTPKPLPKTKAKQPCYRIFRTPKQRCLRTLRPERTAQAEAGAERQDTRCSPVGPLEDFSSSSLAPLQLSLRSPF